jgi:hypothetical protein
MHLILTASISSRSDAGNDSVLVRNRRAIRPVETQLAGKTSAGTDPDGAVEKAVVVDVFATGY